MSRLSCSVAVVCLVATFLPASVNASQLITHMASHRDARSAHIMVNRRGIALLTFRDKGRVQHILARGAINARPPVKGTNQTKFQLDYRGGWGFYRDASYWQRIGPNRCGPYQGPRLAYVIDACTMPDGSHWVIQSWQRRLATYGINGSPQSRVWEMRLSHWNTSLPLLTIHLDWAWHGQYQHLWGRFTYLDKPVFGFKDRQGVPLDAWGRNVYLSTYNSAYGTGWRHENAFLTHDPTGNFCYGFYAHTSKISGREVIRPPGVGERYRATSVGPGVTPDVIWEGAALGPYDPDLDAAANEQQALDLAGDASRWKDKCVIN